MQRSLSWSNRLSSLPLLVVGMVVGGCSTFCSRGGGGGGGGEGDGGGGGEGSGEGGGGGELMGAVTISSSSLFWSSSSNEVNGAGALEFGVSILVVADLSLGVNVVES